MSDKDISKNLFSINSSCSLIGISGEGVIGFLNNLLISDLNLLNNQKFNYSAICNPKGRILSSLWIKILSYNQVQIICPKNISEELVTFFNMRKFRLKIDVSVLDGRIIIDKEKNNLKVIQNDEDDDNLNSDNYYQYLFEHNLPWIDKNNSEKFIPQHVNLDQHLNIMSFTKGCYPGQEIIARIKFLGKIKKRMSLVSHPIKNELSTQIEDKQQVSPIIKMSDKNTYRVQIISQLKDD